VDVILFTDNGRVLKAINRGRIEIKPHVIEVISVFDDGSPVTGLRVRRHATDRHRNRLIVMSRDEIRSIPLHRCHRYVTCRYWYLLWKFCHCQAYAHSNNLQCRVVSRSIFL